MKTWVRTGHRVVMGQEQGDMQQGITEGAIPWQTRSSNGGFHGEEHSWLEGSFLEKWVLFWIVFLSGRNHHWWGHGCRKMIGGVDINIVDFISTEKCTRSGLILACLIILCGLYKDLLKVLTKEQNHWSPFNYKTKSLTILSASSEDNHSRLCYLL